MPEALINVVDVVLLTLKAGELHVVLCQRDNPVGPAHGVWALPGGFVRPAQDADVLATAQRVLRDKAGLSGIYIEQLQVFSGRARDPDRGWTLCVAYCALVREPDLAQPTRADLRLVPVSQLPELPFDHHAIVQTAVERVRVKAAYSSLPVHLCGELFTIPELQSVYEAILGKPVNASSFRRKLEDLDAIEEVPGALRQEGRSRPAQLYRAKRSPDAPLTQLVTRDRGLA